MYLSDFGFVVVVCFLTYPEYGYVTKKTEKLISWSQKTKKILSIFGKSTKYENVI